MLARRRTLIAVALLLAGWAVSAVLAPGLRPFMLDRFRYDCFWGTNGPGWFCEDDPGPNLVVPFTEFLLAAVAVLSIVVLLLRVRPASPARARGALVVLALLPSAWSLLLVVSAVIGLDPTAEAARHLGDFWWVGWSTTSATVLAAVASVLTGLIPARSRVFAVAACLAWAVLLMVAPGFAWVVPLGLALLAALLLLIAPVGLAKGEVSARGTALLDVRGR